MKPYRQPSDTVRIYAFWLSFLGLYLLFPCQNSTIDAWFYAACIKWGEHLFSPHHLFYNALFYVLYQPLKFVGLEVLTFAKSLNALAALCVLWVLNRLLRYVYPALSQAALYGATAFVGVSFGLWRFATENENYVFPVLFSLLASLNYAKFLQGKQTKYLLISGLWATTACFFHQIHIVWYWGLIGGVCFVEAGSLWIRLKRMLLLALPALLFPLVYGWVLVLYEHTPFSIAHLMRFVLHDFYAGNIDSDWGARVFMVMGINLLRTFVQLHGLIYLLVVEKSLFWLVPGLGVWAMMGWTVWKNGLKIKPSPGSHFQRLHVVIALLHIGIAMLSRGNAEFMVMLPALLVLVFAAVFEQLTFRYFVLAMAIWNFAYGVFPLYYFDFQRHQALLSFIQTQKNAIFILNDRPLIENKLYYQGGKEVHAYLHNSPLTFAAKMRPPDSLHQLIRTALEQGQSVYTDALNPPPPMNRQRFLGDGEANAKFFAQYELGKMDLQDKTSLWRVRLHPQPLQ